MAKRINDYDFSGDGRGRPPKYPWAEWTDGEKWEIRNPEDFQISIVNMQTTLYDKASDIGMKVRTRAVRDDEGEGLRFQFYSPESSR